MAALFEIEKDGEEFTWWFRLEAGKDPNRHFPY